MKVITYNLSDSSGCSDGYYACIAEFTGKIIEKAGNSFADFINEFAAYIKKSQIRSERSGYEFAVELLGLGVLWKVYGETSTRLNPLLEAPLIGICRIRNKTHGLKPAFDALKGILITLAFVFQKQSNEMQSIPNVRQLKRLLTWLEAFGDFEQEVKRLKHWVGFLEGLCEKASYSHISSLIDFTDWFEIEAQKSLGKYTCNIDSFIKQKEAAYHWREDYVFCLRKPVEYHYNMVGAELLSREYRKDFMSSGSKVIFVPACMRSCEEGKCKAVAMSSGFACAKCTPGCMVNKITCLGNKNGFEVYMVHHESAVYPRKGGCGIVGISCVTRLIEGGFRAKELGFSPQCVVLDYCGCKKHWDEKGIPTLINMTELNRILQNDLDYKISKKD